MAINPMQRKSRNSFLLGFFLCLIICGSIIALLVFNMMRTKEEEAQQEQEKVMVYVLTKDVQSGEKLDATQFKQMIVDKDAAPADGRIEPATAHGAFAKVDLPRGTIMTASLVYAEEPLTKDVRIQQYGMFVLQKGLQVGDYIDVRFILPTGEDYIVATRKRIVDVSETTVWLEMSEQETLTMSCAIYENYIMKGSALYTTVYVDPGLQGNGESRENIIAVTYPVTGETLNLIRTDPNVVNRAEEGLASERARINAGRELYNQSALQNVDQGVAEQIRKSQEERKKYWDELNGGGY